MLALYIIGGIACGFASGYILARLLTKTSFVPRPEYNELEGRYTDLTESMNDQVVKLTIEEEKSRQLVSERTELRNELVQVREENRKLDIALAKSTADSEALTRNYNERVQETAELKKLLAELDESVKKYARDNHVLSTDNKYLAEKLDSQKKEIDELHKTAHLQFEKIAAQLLEEKSGKFTETNKANIEALLKPLGENIETFKKKVEEVYQSEARERFSLGEKVKDLVEQTNKISTEANNLATALKGQSKTQGDWGEKILESVLQRSGLVKGREYFLQHSFKDEEGNNRRPDVVVNLPDNRTIIIDSKVSLVAYDKYFNSGTPEEHALYAAELLKSIRLHVDGLAEKKYDDLEATLDFTVMFVPIEPAYLIAMQYDNDLWGYAYNKRILLVSPTNLIACVKLIADLWKRELQSRNALKIVERGEKLYEKFVLFGESLADIGKHIDRTQAAYENAKKQLNSGAGNLVRQAGQLKDLGLKSNKEIPKQLISSSDESEEPDVEMDNTDPELKNEN